MDLSSQFIAHAHHESYAGVVIPNKGSVLALRREVVVIGIGGLDVAFVMGVEQIGRLGEYRYPVSEPFLYGCIQLYISGLPDVIIEPKGYIAEPLAGI